MADVTFDWQRRERIGLGEAVLCAGKTAAQIGETIALARARRAALLLTRLPPELLAELAPAELAAIDYDPRSRTAILGTPPAPAGAPPVAVVTAGTSDLPVAREAIRTLAFYGVGAREIADVGVAGLWRILRHEEELRRYRVVIVVAGMEGALFSVVAGLVGGGRDRGSDLDRLRRRARRRDRAPCSARELRAGPGHGQHRQRLRRRQRGPARAREPRPSGRGSRRIRAGIRRRRLG